MMMRRLLTQLQLAHYFTILFSLGLFLTPSVLTAQSGSVFRDYNANGTKDTNEPLVSGIIVKAYNTAGALCASATSAGTNAPNYTLPTTCTGQVRVEFEIPNAIANACGLSNDLDFASYGGSSYGTSVQFISAGGTADFAISNPHQYASPTITNPKIYTLFSMIFLQPIDNQYFMKCKLSVFS
jgi:hypothetical protein